MFDKHEKGKYVYFVRHGESVANAKGVHQDEKPELSELGRKQAEVIGKRFKSIDVDLILSSKYVRAQQTAEIIKKQIGHEIVFEESLHEIKNPSSMTGLSYDDPKATKIRLKREENLSNPDWKFDDGESYYDVIKRGKKALEVIESREEENILVVSHGSFIRFILMNMIWGDEVDLKHDVKIHYFFRTRNTGITWCIHRPDGQWKMLTWNDHAHLGEL